MYSIIKCRITFIYLKNSNYKKFYKKIQCIRNIIIFSRNDLYQNLIELKLISLSEFIRIYYDFIRVYQINPHIF